MKNVSSIILLLLLLSNSFLAFSQNEYLHKLCIKEDKLQEFITKYLITKEEKNRQQILYLVPPAYCQRCDALIPVFNNLLKQKYPSIKTTAVIITDYRKAAENYLKENDIWRPKDGNIIFISWEEFNKFFITNTLELQVPFIVAIETEKSQLKLALPILGAELNQNFADYIVSQLNSNNNVDCDIIKPAKANINLPSQELNNLDSINRIEFSNLISKAKYAQKEEFYLDTLNSIGFLENFNMYDSLIYGTDNFTYFIYILKPEKHNLNVVNCIKPTELEKYYFWDKNIPDQIRNILISFNITRTMYFNPFIYNGLLNIPTSLPKVTFDTAINYFNFPVLVIKSFPSGNLIKVQPLVDTNKVAELSPENSISVSHRKIYIKSNGNYILNAERNTYLSVGGSIPHNYPPDMDPEKDEFYRDAPLFMELSQDFKNKHFIGQLDTIYKFLKCGYMFCNRIYREINHNTYLISDGYSGKIQIFTNDTLLRNINLFQLHLPPFRTNHYSLETLSKVFQIKIEDILIDRNNIYFAIQGFNKIVLGEFNYKNNKFKRLSYIDSNNDMIPKIIKDSKGNIWALVHDTRKRKFIKFTF
ncbi:MAG: hypothetical protein PWR20_1612 [Bacteroidales bacterium]|jgi:hypothetical protein|nr:hypothetical protein [Bacteroidales bacterium]MDN5330733.1 hypothetical protein [Bacteroidales bacterium]NLH53820.1 hypothetical protein [Bacteroidales bacterium]NPV36601.1 hypothetical protein [Bacteroidales bacterium]